MHNYSHLTSEDSSMIKQGDSDFCWGISRTECHAGLGSASLLFGAFRKLSHRDKTCRCNSDLYENFLLFCSFAAPKFVFYLAENRGLFKMNASALSSKIPYMFGLKGKDNAPLSKLLLRFFWPAMCRYLSINLKCDKKWANFCRTLSCC